MTGPTAEPNSDIRHHSGGRPGHGRVFSNRGAQVNAQSKAAAPAAQDLGLEWGGALMGSDFANGGSTA